MTVVTKITCDRCKVNVPKREHKTFSFPIHITETGPSYVQMCEDGKWEGVSGREISKDLCLHCYNELYKNAFDFVTTDAQDEEWVD